MSLLKAKAIWENKVIAESDKCLDFDNNVYFPKEDLKMEFFKECDNKTICGWKGEASYYDIDVANNKNPSSAWYYPNPKEKAEEIKGMVAFWNGIEVEIIK